MEACRGIVSLEVGPVPYEVLLSPALSSVTHLVLAHPKHMSTTAPSSPPPPFRLSHLELNARERIHQEILVGLLEGSSGNLTTLTLHHMGGIPDPVASITDVLSRTSFAHLRRLNIDSNDLITYTSVLSLLPALEDLTLRIGAGVPRGGLGVYRVFSAVANACGPTLLALDVQHTRKSPRVNFRDLSESLEFTGFQNLRKLYLPVWLRLDALESERPWWKEPEDVEADSEGEIEEWWDNFRGVCEARSLKFMFGGRHNKTWQGSSCLPFSVLAFADSC